MSGDGCQGGVEGEERGFERLGKSEVGRIVGALVVPQLTYGVCTPSSSSSFVSFRVPRRFRSNVCSSLERFTHIRAPVEGFVA